MTATGAPPQGTTGTLRCCLYCRVSTAAGQDTENQRLQLRAFAASQGWEIVREYEDCESGGKADRAGFQAMPPAVSCVRVSGPKAVVPSRQRGRA